jgi:DnaK suppressor protein
MSSVSSRQPGERVPQSVQQRMLERLLRRHGEQLEKWKQVLRQELPAVAADVRDIVEDGVDHLARAVGVAAVQVSASTVRGIETALGRLRKGTYGSCEDCGKRIPRARLKVLPFAERCRDCQEECEGMQALSTGGPLASC